MDCAVNSCKALTFWGSMLCPNHQRKYQDSIPHHFNSINQYLEYINNRQSNFLGVTKSDADTMREIVAASIKEIAKQREKSRNMAYNKAITIITSRAKEGHSYITKDSLLLNIGTGYNTDYLMDNLIDKGGFTLDEDCVNWGKENIK